MCSEVQLYLGERKRRLCQRLQDSSSRLSPWHDRGSGTQYSAACHCPPVWPRTAWAAVASSRSKRYTPNRPAQELQAMQHQDKIPKATSRRRLSAAAAAAVP